MDTEYRIQFSQEHLKNVRTEIYYIYNMYIIYIVIYNMYFSPLICSDSSPKKLYFCILYSVSIVIVLF